MQNFPNRPQVSIIVPVYNRTHFIQRAIDSVKAQTFKNWELLIVDDGSTDGLEELIIPQIQSDSQMRYMKHSNRKLSSTRNIGIHAAMGHYITQLDSDDEFHPDHIKLRVEYMNKNPHIDFIHGGAELIGPEESHYVQDAFDPTKKIHILECCLGPTIFGKKEAFMVSGGFNIQPYSAESEFLPRIEKEFQVQKVDFPTYRYYTGLEDSICTLRKIAGENHHDKKE